MYGHRTLKSNWSPDRYVKLIILPRAPVETEAGFSTSQTSTGQNIAARCAHFLTELEVVSNDKCWHIFTIRAFSSVETDNPRI